MAKVFRLHIYLCLFVLSMSNISPNDSKYGILWYDNIEEGNGDSQRFSRDVGYNMDQVKWTHQALIHKHSLVKLETHSQKQYSEEDTTDKMIAYLKIVICKQSIDNELGWNCKSVFSCLDVYPQKHISVLQNYHTEEEPEMDLKVGPVHKMGYTGKGVTVAIVDDGVEHNNTDFNYNFISNLSYDMCNNIPGSPPESGFHGTMGAGVIAMKPNENGCGVGIAYNANIVGIRAVCEHEQEHSMLAKALIHHLNEIDIYSNAWGQPSLGYQIFLRDEMIHVAYHQGITKGRKGKGAIYVRSAGNDKIFHENCAVDADINSPYVITIAAADRWGEPTKYSERCTAIIATAYPYKNNSGNTMAHKTGEECVLTSNFDGTSAACAQASGIIALVLEANPDLTYRDVMHLITMSAEVVPFAHNRHLWYKNGAGFWVSNDFGFGLMNAEKMVNLAKDWTNVPVKSICVIRMNLDEPRYFDHEMSASIQFKTLSCQGQPEDVRYLEHIELYSVVEYPIRGDITIYVESPTGTKSQLLETRKYDENSDGHKGLTIVSTHNWGENPQGLWTVTYKASIFGENYQGLVKNVSLTFHGTTERPAHYNKREYTPFRLPNK